MKTSLKKSAKPPGAGGTINDVVRRRFEAMARYLVAHDENVDATPAHHVPGQLRTEGQQGALGNQVSAIFPMLPAWPMNVTTRLGAVCAEVERIKEGQEAQSLTLLQNSVPEPWPVALAPTQLIGTRFDPTAFAARFPMPVLPTIGGRRPPNFGLNFVCTNVPGVQVAQYLCGHRVLDTIGVLVLSGNIGLGITILSYNQGSAIATALAAGSRNVDRCSANRVQRIACGSTLAQRTGTSAVVRERQFPLSESARERPWQAT
jgi:hypothetical protein